MKHLERTSIKVIFLAIMLLSFISPSSFAFGEYYSPDKPIPLEFNNYNLEISPYYLIYNDNYRIVRYSSLPTEGDEIVVWFKLIVYSENISLNDGISIVTYAISPEGNIQEDITLFVNYPIFNGGIYYKNGKYTGSRGFNIDSTIPGIWKIKYVALNQSESQKFYQLSLEEKMNYTGFKTYKINVIPFNQKQIINLSKFAIIATFFAVIVGFLLSELASKRREKFKQISLLESLYSELSAISSKKREIKILNKKILTEGNLQWIKELFNIGLKPAHGIWNLNIQLYVIGLNRTINNKKTKPLKDALIHIGQKIELIGNYLNQYNQIPEKIAEINREPIKEAITNVVKEVIELVEVTKEFIEKEFEVNEES